MKLLAVFVLVLTSISGIPLLDLNDLSTRHHNNLDGTVQNLDVSVAGTLNQIKDILEDDIESINAVLNQWVGPGVDGNVIEIDKVQNSLRELVESIEDILISGTDSFDKDDLKEALEKLACDLLFLNSNVERSAVGIADVVLINDLLQNLVTPVQLGTVINIILRHVVGGFLNDPIPKEVITMLNCGDVDY